MTGGDLSATLHYNKPNSRPEPILNTNISAVDILPKVVEEVSTSRVVELLYHLGRAGLLNDTSTSPGLPPWNHFHQILSKCTEPHIVPSTIAYNPILMANPSDYNTIYTILKRSKEIANHLGFDHSPIVFDMGLLGKALEITWASDDLEGVIPFEGGMHLIMSIISGIGYVYGDAGLELMLHQSGVFAASTAHHMLTGKDFDRALYGLKLFDEVLWKRLLANFMVWCREQGIEIPDTSTEGKKFECAVRSNHDDIAQAYQDLEVTIRDFFQLHLSAFREYGKESSPTFQLWDDYLFKVSLPLKQFICATRNGLWDTYQAARAEFLPFLFISNRTNYSRYMTYLILSMQHLPQSVQTAFENGQFVAKLTDGLWNGVWLDYALETTENKALKGQGGIIGLTHSNALSRWFMSRPITAQYAMKYSRERHAGEINQSGNKSQLQSASEKRWDSDLHKMELMFDGSYIDPFQVATAPVHLVNFATGVVAPSDVENTMLSALTTGSAMATQFVTQRFIDKEKSFYAPMTKSKLKTMASMKKQVKVKHKQVTMSAEIMYLRLLAMNAVKQVPLARVMAFENAPVPLSMFSEEGVMHSGTKSDMMHKLEDLLPEHLQELKTVTNIDTVIYDGHAEIQAMPGPTSASNTFQQMGNGYLKAIFSKTEKQISKRCTQYHIVFDKYQPQSIKTGTREKRGDIIDGYVHHIEKDVAVPGDWRKFLMCGENKAQLARCYIDIITRNVTSSDLLSNTSFYLSGGTSKSITCLYANTVEVLEEDHEEADTRIVLHAMLAANKGAKNIVIASPDTDVLMLLLHHRMKIKARQIYLYTGRIGINTNMKRFIPIHTLYQLLSAPMRNIMLQVYCLTGCDTTSSFHFKGKKQAFKMIQNNCKARKYQNMKLLSSGRDLTTDTKNACIGFVGELYGSYKCTSLDTLRAHKASCKNPVSVKRMPPTSNSFNLHMLRCQYQLMAWGKAGVYMQDLPDPRHFGYEEVDGRMQPIMMSQPPAAPELLNNLVCCCQDMCESICICKQHDQPCTAACDCEGMDNDGQCCNPVTIVVSLEMEDD